ncbi:hypothetical protein SAMN06295912_1454 [Sphingomonas laterariae]|uniref:DUF4139 domain-containing protein n=1 Tax=Edaphosphingomonas laterariae TaxID=861865 RepID=A0A239K513_9SPHN|nr:DUF4139 domain-containing protein [Sphingomonas laterariae]SNT12772.1 hypothetical protein SAMN06295912_1454 [Sphingomonas laterariae]
MLIAALLAMAAPAEAAVVTSSSPEAVSVSVYRNPDRAVDDEMALRWLKGFALITETRTVDLPAGDATIRFEGVAGGILPQSAIIVGLPGQVGEKNRDARLLSPGSLLDGHLGRRVRIRRTNRATGAVREEDAVVRAGPDGGVILQTAEGIEALGCSGLPEQPIYDAVPDGLSDKPTLSVTTSSPVGGPVRLALSYLADGFDWQANYVAHVAPDGASLDLFGWLTLANGNAESFVAARTQAIAGTPNREAKDRDDHDAAVNAELVLQCWPMGTTRDPAVEPLPPPAPAPMAAFGFEEIVVTGARRLEVVQAVPVTAMMAGQEELGDLKLYRIPERVTVAANAMKQVALLDRRNVPFDRLYRATLTMDDEADEEPAEIVVRMRNLKAKGLGLPLPSGQVAVFEPSGSRPMLAGEGHIGDTAIGQDVELAIGESPQVHFTQRWLDRDLEEEHLADRRFEVEITNANPHPIRVEVSFARYLATVHLIRPSEKMREKDGRPMWLAKVPANGTAKLTYVVRHDRDDRGDD